MLRPNVTWVLLLLWPLAACGGDDNAVGGDFASAGPDTDKDGYTDAEEQSAGALLDTDGDGVPDWQDPDSHPLVLDRDDSCPSGNANASKGAARVILLLDGSTSMDDGLGGGQSRWQAMRSALMDQVDGVVPQLQSVVEFGMVVYSGSLGSFGGGGNMGPDGCPELSVTPAAYDNFPVLDMNLPNNQPGGSTPTHLALQHLVDPASGIFAADQPDGPAQSQVLIIATDGQPNNICQGGMEVADPQAAADVVSAVQAASNLGVRTYVISLAGNDGGLMAHLDEVAVAGGTMEPPFVPQDRDELTSTLQAIVGGAIGCRILLDGMVEAGMECSGRVMLSGRALTCGDDYEVRGGRAIELVGAACDEFMANPVSLVHADFPCGTFVADDPQ